jgi:hypothetical protein
MGENAREEPGFYSPNPELLGKPSKNGTQVGDQNELSDFGTALERLSLHCSSPPECRKSILRVNAGA